VIRLTLPYPVSANVYWASRVVKPKGKPARAMTYVTPEAEAYREKVAKIARAAGLAAPMAVRVEMWIRLYPARPLDWAKRTRQDPACWDDTVLCMDLGNCEKVLADALQGIVYVDDKQIWRQHKERMEPDEKGARVELAIRAMPPRVVPQADLLGQAA
jgi:crossover junction endodeoxyribonuclease RusA